MSGIIVPHALFFYQCFYGCQSCRYSVVDVWPSGVPVCAAFFCAPQAAGEGVVVDSSVVHGRGGVADVLVSWGKLKVGDVVVSGKEYGRVRT